MTGRLWLPGILVLASPLLLTSQTLPQAPQAESGGVADIAVQGYYLGGNSQPLSALSGVDIAFREYLPRLGLLTGNLEGYDDSTRGRTGDNSITLHGLLWKGRRWTITGGDFRFRTALFTPPFTNYSYPEIGVRGVKVEMTDGFRHFTIFEGEETLQAGPRITFRTEVPQSILGAAVEQNFGSRLSVGVRYFALSSGESQIAANPFFFPEGSQFQRTDSVSFQTEYRAGGGLTLFSDVVLSHEEFAPTVLYTRTAPFSSLAGAKWQRKRVTVTANYGSLSRSALPVLGYYFGDRTGAFAEARYKVFATLELFGSAGSARNNIEKNPDLPNLSTEDVTGGANVVLPGKIGLSGQYSKISLRGELLSDPSQNQSQHSSQSQASLNRSIKSHSLTLTVRDLNLTDQNFRQKQKSAEVQDNLHVSRLILGGAVRMQQQSASGQLQNSVFVRGSGQLRLRHFSVYGQFEAGNDLVNKSLFSTNTVNTTVAGVQVPVLHGWTVQLEAFRTTLLATLNPSNVLVMQTDGVGAADILNSFNQWSFFLRLSHSAHWGAPLPQILESTNQVIYGAIEGLVYDDATGSRGAPGISVQLDKSRTSSTDADGRYRFEDVPEGAHEVALNIAELPAEYSPGPAPPAALAVKPRGVARADLRIVKAGSSIRGAVLGLATEDEGVVRLENIVIDLSTEGKDDTYTSCDARGEFGFYNLSAGHYMVSLDRSTLPEDYVVVSTGPSVVDLGASDPPTLVLRIEKRVRQLPVRKISVSGVD